MAAKGGVTISINGDVSLFRGALGDAERGLAGFSQRMEATGKKLRGIGTRLTLGITAPLAILGKTAFDAAADLNESINKVNVVFGDSAAAIRRWAEDASSNLLMSKRAALEAAGTLGSVFKASGLGVSEAAEMSRAMVQLAADMASFNNVAVDETLAAIRSGLVGEFEPLRRFGVLLDSAAVNAKALEMGLGDVHGEISEGEEVQARYALILEQTSDQQGDVERTADSAANKQKELRAEFDDTAAALGQSLIPVMQTLMEVLQGVTDWFGKLDPTLQKIIVITGIVVAVIGPLATAIGVLAKVIGVLATGVAAVFSSTVGLVILAIVALVATIVFMWAKWDEIWRFMKDNPAITSLFVILQWLLVALFLIVGAVKFLYENWSEIWSKIRDALQDVWGGIERILNELWGAVETLGEIWSENWSKIRDALQDVWGGIESILNELWGAVKTLDEIWSENWSKIRDVLRDVWGGIEWILNGLWGAVLWIGSGIVWLADVASEAFGRFKEAVSDMWDTVDGPLLWLWERLRDILSVARRLGDALARLPGSAGGLIPGLGGGLIPSGIPFVGYLDSGGMIPGPVGKPYWAVVHGGEEVLNPAQQAARRSAARGVVVHVHGHVLTDRQLAEIIAAQLSRAGGPQISQRAVA